MGLQVLISMVYLPEAMPASFQATYTPVESAGTEAQIKHLSRLMATQMTAAGLGPGERAARVPFPAFFLGHSTPTPFAVGEREGRGGCGGGRPQWAPQGWGDQAFTKGRSCPNVVSSRDWMTLSGRGRGHGCRLPGLQRSF